MIIATREVRRAIVAHARRDAPRECCGLLLGHGPRVRFALPMANIEEGTSRYRIADRAHVELRRLLRRVVPALGIVGVYHSHPAGDPDPSPTDIAESMYPEWVYLIIGLKHGRARVRAFRIRGGRARVLPIRWIGGSRA